MLQQAEERLVVRESMMMTGPRDRRFSQKYLVSDETEALRTQLNDLKIRRSKCYNEFIEEIPSEVTEARNENFGRKYSSIFAKGPVAKEKDRREGLQMMHLNAVFKPRIRAILSEADRVLTSLNE